MCTYLESSTSSEMNKEKKKRKRKIIRVKQSRFKLQEKGRKNKNEMGELVRLNPDVEREGWDDQSWREKGNIWEMWR